MRIDLPFPSSKLSGQHNAHHWVTRPVINAHREQAKDATEKASPSIPEEGDIRVHVRFVPPDRRGDRVNFPNRMKPYFDGIADALGVNDARFLPSYEFAEPEKPGRVEVFIHSNSRGQECHLHLRGAAMAPQDSGSDASANSTSEPDPDRIGGAS